MKILRGSFPPISSNYSKSFRDLINKMLNIMPSQRPNILEVMKTPIIKRKIINYLAESLKTYDKSFKDSNNRPTVDLDDMYIDSLRDQTDKLNLTQIVNEYNGNNI
jgi:serine/threonine protein kinase